MNWLLLMVIYFLLLAALLLGGCTKCYTEETVEKGAGGITISKTSLEICVPR